MYWVGQKVCFLVFHMVTQKKVSNKLFLAKYFRTRERWWLHNLVDGTKNLFFFGVIIFVCFQLRYSWWCTILYKFQVYNVVVESFLSLCSICWRRKWQPTPVFLPEESHRQRSLEGYSPWGHRESDTTERPSIHILFTGIIKCWLYSLYCTIHPCSLYFIHNENESCSVVSDSLRPHGL